LTSLLTLADWSLSHFRKLFCGTGAGTAAGCLPNLEQDQAGKSNITGQLITEMIRASACTYSSLRLDFLIVLIQIFQRLILHLVYTTFP
jgi:hypothetical protein